MVPVFDDELEGLENDFEIVTEPSYNPKLDMVNHELIGYTDGLEALIQDIHIKLSVERYEYSSIFPDSEFVEFRDLIGEEQSYVEGELQLRIEECLLCDDRIDTLSDFEINYLAQKGAINAKFTVHSIYGSKEVEKEFNAREAI